MVFRQPGLFKDGPRQLLLTLSDRRDWSGQGVGCVITRCSVPCLHVREP
jgi:hypothetical protein